MRWVAVVLTGVVIAGLAGSAVGQPSGCAGCNGKTLFPYAGHWSMDGAPCCSPPGFTLVPGCCECSRHCCDNAWAGYCDHRAKVENFWSRVGVPKPHRCCPVVQSTAPTPACPEAPMPDVRPAPQLTPTPAAAAARPAPTARPSRTYIAPPRTAAEKQPVERSTASLWLWRF
jgi:hypothetical protein